MSQRALELVAECKRQSESCLYTSTALYIWLRCCRWLKVIFIIVPLILGSLSTWNLLAQSASHVTLVFTAVCGLLAGMLPAVYAALKLDSHLEACCRLAGEFKNLQDRFRQAALVNSESTFLEFQVQVSRLMDRLDAARAESFTAPEWVFRLAQKKIKKGDYAFDSDQQIEESLKGTKSVSLSYVTAQESDTENPE